MNRFNWPALQDFTIPDTLAIEYEQGVWGKAHGARTDYRWLALTPEANFKKIGLEHDLHFADEEEPRTSFFWRSLDGHHYAVMAYPSQAEDASGRSGFLEKQVLRLSAPQKNIPAALAAILLFSELYHYDDSVWWNRHKEVDWEANPHDYLILSPGEQKIFNKSEIEQLLDQAIADLKSYFRRKKDDLEQLYAQLHVSSTSQLESSTPLSHLALAALLLPLPRKEADTLSLAGWYPSTTISREMTVKWNVLILSSNLFTKLHISESSDKAPLKEEHIQYAENLVEAIFSNNPQLLPTSHHAMTKEPDSSAIDSDSDIYLTLWGPSAAGKTVFLAQLDIAASANVHQDPNKKDWQIFPKSVSIDFTSAMREQMRKENHFPKATTGSVEEIAFTFKKGNINATLKVDDRPGAHYEDYVSLQSKADKTQMEAHLSQTEGFVLLFDPDAEIAKLAQQIWSTVERLGHDNTRPVAICVSKSDLLVETTHDYQAMTSADPKQQHDFVKNYLLSKDERLLDTIERYTTNYRFFPVSAAGIRHHYGIIEPVVFYDESFKPRICSEDKPINLLAPFFWVLDEIILMRNQKGTSS